jgi:LPXTG-site transpeptidase (sortase) family protein
MPRVSSVLSCLAVSDRLRCPYKMLATIALLVSIAVCGCGEAAHSEASGSGGPFPSSALTGALALDSQLRADPSIGMGMIRIPQIQLEARVVEGVEEEDLEAGPGHWPETPLPGQHGRVVISGHRTTFGGPFLRLDELEPGDEIDLVLPYGTARYEVTEILIVGPTDVWVVGQRGVEELSLTTCHPIYSEKERLIVQARAVSFDPLVRLEETYAQ